MTKLEQVAQLIQEIGYKAKIDDDFIRTSMSGWNVMVFFYSDNAIQMYFGVSLDEDHGFGLEQANKFNRAFRFIKCYIVEQAAKFEQDYYFDVSKPTAKTDLEQIFASWESAIGMARKALEESREVHRALTSPRES